MRRMDFAAGILTVLVACSVAFAARDSKPEPVPVSRGGDGAPVASQESLRERGELISRISWRLEALQEREFAEDKAALTRAISVLRAADENLKEAVSDERLAGDRKRSHSRLRLAMESGVRGQYGYYLSLIARYGFDHEERPPGQVSLLVPEIASSLPTLSLPDHPPSGETREIRRFRGKSLSAYFKDSGKWLYISDPKSKHFGLLIVDCSHKSASTGVWHDFRLR